MKHLTGPFQKASALLTNKFTLAAAGGAAALVLGASPLMAAGVAALSGFYLGTKTGRGLLTNKFFIASGMAVFALGMGFPITTDIGSIGLSALSFAFKYSIGLAVAGFAGLFASRMLRNAWGNDRQWHRHKVLVKEGAGTAAGITGFLGASFLGPLFSGSVHSNPERVWNVYNTEGLGAAYDVVNDQRAKILLDGSAAVDQYVSGGQSLQDIIKGYFDSAPDQKVAELDSIAQLMQIPEVQSAAIVLGLSVAASVGFYLLGRRIFYREKDFPQGKREHDLKEHERKSLALS